MLDAEHRNRTALALGNTGLASGQLGHDDLWVDTIGPHVAMVAIAGDDAVLVAVERRLQPDRAGFLSDIEVAEAADQAETIELARLHRTSVVKGKSESVRVDLGGPRSIKKHTEEQQTTH